MRWAPWCVALAVLSVSARADAQETPTNFAGWYGYEGYNPVHRGSPWGIMLEGYVKRVDWALLEPQGVFGRIGVDYELRNGDRIAGGYAIQYNNDYDEVAQPYDWIDHRIWQQYLLRRTLGSDPRQMGSLRFRMEERFLGRATPPDSTVVDHYEFETTFRLQARINHPITPMVSLAFYDELHLRMIPTDENLLDQNRVYAGLMFYLDKDRLWRIEPGYMWHAMYNAPENDRGRTRINHTFRLTLTSDAPWGN